jgi:hypothetical protein
VREGASGGPGAGGATDSTAGAADRPRSRHKRGPGTGRGAASWSREEVAAAHAAWEQRQAAPEVRALSAVRSALPIASFRCAAPASAGCVWLAATSSQRSRSCRNAAFPSFTAVVARSTA